MKVGDLTGQKFGYLTAVHRDGAKHRVWVCRCDCGSDCLVEGSRLKRGIRTSCGCRGVEDITSQRFGYLTLLRLKETRRQKTFFECLCDCGKTTVVGRYKLTHSSTRSCGCLYTKTREGERKEFGASAARSVLKEYRRSARVRHLVFSLTDGETLKLIKGYCAYCGAEPQRKVELKTGYGFFMCNGIDRLDNTKGYIAGNVVPACKKCNYRKQAESEKDFLNWIRQVAIHRLGMG